MEGKEEEEEEEKEEEEDNREEEEKEDRRKKEKRSLAMLSIVYPGDAGIFLPFFTDCLLELFFLLHLHFIWNSGSS